MSLRVTEMMGFDAPAAFLAWQPKYQRDWTDTELYVLLRLKTDGIQY